MAFKKFPIGKPVNPLLAAAISRQWRIALSRMTEVNREEEYNLASHRWHYFALRACTSHCEPVLNPDVVHTPDQESVACHALLEFQKNTDWGFFEHLEVSQDVRFGTTLLPPRQEMRLQFQQVAKLYDQMMEAKDLPERVPFTTWRTWHADHDQQDGIEAIISGMDTCRL